jgi:integrase
MDNEGGRTAPLTKDTIKGLAPEDARYIVWDGALKGFGLRVEPSGVKTFLVRYRAGGGRNGTRRQLTIGRYGVLTPEQARGAAKAALANVALGQDPQAERAEQRKIGTVADLCDLYLKEGVGAKAASTVALDRIRLEVIKRLIGRRTATQLTGADVERMRDAIAEGRLGKPLVDDEGGAAGEPIEPKRVKRAGDKARGGRTASTKAVKLVRSVYAWAIEGKRLPMTENPTAGVKTFADNARERFLSPAELGRLGDVLTAASAMPDPKGRRTAHVRVIRLLLLTGARKNEIAGLRWSEVQDGYLQLEKSKTGRKVVPLGAAAQAILADLPRNGDLVFPDPEHPGEAIHNLDWAWVGFRKAAGLDDVRIHDLRHSFASVGVAGGSALFLISKLLGHRHVATTQRYAHLADDPVKAAADKIASAIDAAMKGDGAELSKVGAGR